DFPHTYARTVERNNVYIHAAKPSAEIRIVIDASDRVSKSRIGHPIQKIDEPVLHTAHVEVVDDMENQAPWIFADWAMSCFALRRPQHSRIRCPHIEYVAQERIEHEQTPNGCAVVAGAGLVLVEQTAQE